MANPVDPGTFDAWITSRIGFVVTRPKSGSTGSFDNWITVRISLDTYSEEVTGDKNISVSDSIAVGESVNVVRVVPGEINISVSDGVTIAESIAIAPDLVIAESEAVTVAETIFVGFQGIPATIMGYWKLEEATDTTTLADSSGRGHTATRQAGSTAQITGVVGNGLDDASDGWFSAPDSDDWDFLLAEGFSLEAWVRVDGTDTAQRALLGRTASPQPNHRWWLMAPYASSTQPVLGLTDDSPVGNEIYPDVDITDNQWHHIVFLVTPTFTMFFLDGQFVKSQPHNFVDDFKDTVGTLDIFNRTFSTWQFGSQADEIAIWRGNLTDQQILDHYNGGTGQAYELFIQASDSVAVAEAATVQIPAGADLSISVNDAITVADAATLDLPITISQSDAVTVTDTVSIAQLAIDLTASDAIIVTDVATVDIPLEIAVSDAVTVVDVVSVAVSDPQVSTSDSVSVTDIAVIDLQIDIAESDAITITDTAALDLTIGISESDAISVSEAVSIDPLLLAIFQNQSVSVGESINVVVPAEGELNISVDDSISVVDTATLQNDIPGINVAVDNFDYWIVGVKITP